ncbi:hypothetical protein VHUM_00100 [Vanrija humicola]|uniref:Uncharacterized protein n=1 Tax=Vanrija humicola TaxID=5417 RepID=A0A7D8V473_VANHU|nr:hypothetical protein VHUM_00100 [Vanrija humicola]
MAVGLAGEDAAQLVADLGVEVDLGNGRDDFVAWSERVSQCGGRGEPGGRVGDVVVRAPGGRRGGAADSARLGSVRLNSTHLPRPMRGLMAPLRALRRGAQASW